MFAARTAIASLALILLASAGTAQQHVLRAPDGTPAVLPASPPVVVVPVPVPPVPVPPVPATATVIPVLPGAPAPTVTLVPAPVPAVPTMTVRTVGELHALCAKQDTADQINMCLNLLSSATDSIRETERQRGSRYVCNNEALQNHKVRQTFLGWAQANPNFMGEDANRGVLTALSMAYPCPVDNVIAPPAIPVAPMSMGPANPITGY